MSVYRFALLLLFVFWSGGVEAEFFDIFSMYKHEEVYKDLKANYPEFPFTVTPNSEGKASYDLTDGKIQVFPCGPLMAYMVAVTGKKEVMIYHFVNNDATNSKQSGKNTKVDSLLPKFGIQRFDLIVGVNGKLFEQAQPRRNDFGEYGPIMDIALAIEEGQAKGSMQLLIKRGADSDPRPIMVKLAKMPPFAPNFPTKCQRSAIMAKEILDMLAKDSERPSKSNGLSYPLVGLSMLAYGEKKYKAAIEDYLLHILSNEEKDKWNSPFRVAHQGEGNSWVHGFKIVFLAEYFYATGDMRVLPILQRFAYAAHEEHQNAFGAGAHGKGGIGSYFSIGFGPPTGLNALGMALAEKAGCKVNAKGYQNYFDYATRSVDIWANTGNYDYEFKVKDNKFYYNCYAHITYEGDRPQTNPLQNLNTGVAALAFNHINLPNPEAKKLSYKLLDNLIFNYTTSSYIHATPSIGHFWVTMALNAMTYTGRPLPAGIVAGFNNEYSKNYTFNQDRTGTKFAVKEMNDRQAWRKIMDYRKYYLILSRFNSTTYNFFYPRLANSGSWGGDGYLNLQGSQLYTMLSLLGAHKRNLLMQGNPHRNWFSDEGPRSAKQTMAGIHKYHDMYSTELLKELELLYQMKDKSGATLPEPKSREEMLERKLIAYEASAKIVDNYRRYPAAKRAFAIQKRLVGELGGPKKLPALLKNLDGMRKIRYAIKDHERDAMKAWQPRRIQILELVRNSCKGLPAEKVAAEELVKTKAMTFAEGDSGGSSH